MVVSELSDRRDGEGVRSNDELYVGEKDSLIEETVSAVVVIVEVFVVIVEVVEAGNG